MGAERTYDSLPFTWNPDTYPNDCQWLESIIRNAAPFSDWWTKARIVQLAYPNPPNDTPHGTDALPTYAGLNSEQAIAQAVRSLCDLKQYVAFAEQVNEEYVITTLNRWHNRQFSQAIGRNFEVYADRNYPNIFLVASTATTSLHVDRQLPPLQRFRPLFNIDELVKILWSSGCNRLTVRIHGYATPDSLFYQNFLDEAESLTLKGPINSAGTLEDKHFYIGYHWPSEQPLLSPGLWSDYRNNWGIIVKFLAIMAAVALSAGTLLYIFLQLLGVPLLLALGTLPTVAQVEAWLKLRETAELAVQWPWVVLVVFLLWLILFQLLRVVVYQRDRYRAVHYGAPDLAEFFWRLDKGLGLLNHPHNSVQPPTQYWDNPSPGEIEHSPPSRSQEYTLQPAKIAVNLLGHSLGALVVVNLLRILCDRFGKDDRIEQEKHEIGDCLTLDKLVLSSPDIPLEFLREGRNNYVRSAILRCRSIYLLSSDRDVVLRYLSTVANWFIEPSLEMSGLRLGNVYLQAVNKPVDPLEYRPYIRTMIRSQPVVKPTSAYELFEKFNYLDCSEMPGLDGTQLRLSLLTAPLIDLGNIFLYLFGKIDSHGGYFWTETPSFEVVKFVLANDEVSVETIQVGIKRLIANTPIRFWPSQPFLSSHPPSDRG
ncbi:MAG: 2-C-methyl-D-erythritol 4-phosphate cytidylyltransferase [Actinomycetota bacterium]